MGNATRIILFRLLLVVCGQGEGKLRGFVSFQFLKTIHETSFKKQKEQTPFCAEE